MAVGVMQKRDRQGGLRTVGGGGMLGSGRAAARRSRTAARVMAAATQYALDVHAVQTTCARAHAHHVEVLADRQHDRVRGAHDVEHRPLVVGVALALDVIAVREHRGSPEREREEDEEADRPHDPAEPAEGVRQAEHAGADDRGDEVARRGHPGAWFDVVCLFLLGVGQAVRWASEARRA